MKATFSLFFAALAVSTIALAQPHRAMTMKRSEFKDSELLKRASSVVDANNKRSDDVADSVNYILVLLKDSDTRTDAYQDEIDAITDPKTVLGKRSDDVADSVNYILVLLKDSDTRADAYQDEIDAVTDPKSVLG
ncbi:MAG: hypothetical protein LQ342_008250 [Letrouitia transgressa]|nr:MAG: hypothetical protein LQ342_008250 [Letrouitia transgressa]